MTHSNLLPGTTHVFIHGADFNDEQLEWCEENTTCRVDAFAYNGDDLLDHQHIAAVINNQQYHSFNAMDDDDLVFWARMLQENDEEALILFAFASADDAMRFKLTFCGAPV